MDEILPHYGGKDYSDQVSYAKGVIDSIDQLLCKFMLDNGKESRRHWVNRYTICQPNSAGGLGIKNLRQAMNMLRGKLAWQYLGQKPFGLSM